jgi:hypothetical protein
MRTVSVGTNTPHVVLCFGEPALGHLLYFPHTLQYRWLQYPAAVNILNVCKHLLLFRGPIELGSRTVPSRRPTEFFEVGLSQAKRVLLSRTCTAIHIYICAPRYTCECMYMRDSLDNWKALGPLLTSRIKIM